MGEEVAYRSVTSSLTILGLSYVVYLVCQGIWRLYFSPISKFPGPKLAALTYWYEFYYDAVVGGKYVFKVIDLHKEYGPIIRINPHELHVSDPEFFGEIYAGAGHRRDRDAWHTSGLTLPDSVLESPPHDLHRRRRAALSPFFSMASTRKLTPLVVERSEALMARFEELRGNDEPINILYALSAFANDVIHEYLFGESDNIVQAKDFDPTTYIKEIEATKMVHVFRQFPWILSIVFALPQWLGVYMGTTLKAITILRIKYRKQIEKTKDPSSQGKAERLTIFHSLLDSDLPESEKNTNRLTSEAIVLAGAGLHTVAWALTVSIYHVLSSPSILKNLKDELARAQREKPNGEALTVPDYEKLPYLTAVIKEGLRLSYGASVRFPRIARTETMHYKSWAIPPGTSVSTYHRVAHHDENIFPSPTLFKPERWLEDKTGKLDKCLCSFGAGSRICLGINLAWTELYLCLAAVFSNFGGKEYRLEGDKGVLELFETDVGDVEMHRDYFFAVAKDGSQGVRIKILP